MLPPPSGLSSGEVGIARLRIPPAFMGRLQKTDRGYHLRICFIGDIPYFKPGKPTRLLVAQEIILPIKIFYRDLHGPALRPFPAGNVFYDFWLGRVSDIYDHRPARLDLAAQGVEPLTPVMADVGVITLQNHLQTIPPMEVAMPDEPDIFCFRRMGHLWQEKGTPEPTPNDSPY